MLYVQFYVSDVSFVVLLWSVVFNGQDGRELKNNSYQKFVIVHYDMYAWWPQTV